MRVIFRQLDHSAAYGMWIYKLDGNRNLVAEPLHLTMKEVPEGYMLPEPTMIIPFVEAQEFLQSMVNGLIDLGVRPNNDRTAGELEATKKHLKDLQDMSTKLLNILCSSKIEY